MRTKNFFARTKIFAVLMAICVMFSAVPSVYAAEAPDDGMNGLAVELESGSADYEKALQSLGLTEEEAAECNIYAVDIDPVAPATTIPTDGSFCRFSPFTFYQSTAGGYWTCNASQLRWSFEWNGTYDSSSDLNLTVSLYRHPSTESLRIAQVTRSNGVSYGSGWIPVTKNADYKFKYRCEYASNGNPGWASVSMYVASRN